MNVLGIVAEYNPFHNGHLWHMQQAMQLCGASYCIVAMSGNFVQRGEPACADKYTRAEWAVTCGADLVLEIPSVFCLSSAERFASGAVKTLASTGVVTHLAFGCELADLAALGYIANFMDNETPAFKQALNSNLAAGLSYPQAKHRALASAGLGAKYLNALTRPNNILAVEYIRCINRLGLDIKLIPIQRESCEHSDTELSGVVSSASAIRLALSARNPAVYEALPSPTALSLQFNASLPITLETTEQLMLYKLRTMPPADIAKLPDVTEGFENVLSREAARCADAETFFAACKNRRYTMARVKRICMCAILDISRDLADEMSLTTRNLYMKILARRRSAVSLVSAISSISPIPLLHRNSDAINCSSAAKASLAVDALSTDVLAIATREDLHRDSQGPLVINM